MKSLSKIYLSFFMVFCSLSLAVGSEIGEKDINEATPLICAAQKGHLEIVKVLLEKGADINLSDNAEKTALDRADKNKETNKEAIKVALREAGAKKSVELPNDVKEGTKKVFK